MSQFDKHFTAREKVLHKLAGAAYQMTFEADGEGAPEYDQAAATMAMAVEFWGNSQGEDFWEMDAVSLDPLSLFEDGDLKQNGHIETDTTEPPTVPGLGTQSRSAVLALLRTHRDGIEWAAPKQIRARGDGSGAIYQISALRQHYDWIQWRKTDGLANEYRVDPDRREAVWAAIREGGEGSEGATA